MNPTVRPITEEEKPLAEALYRNTFKIDTEASLRWLKLTNLPDTRAIVDEGRVMSMLVILPLKVWMGGRPMKMGGISGVATWADQQGKGYAATLMRQAINDMRERAESISILYPFSFTFYSRFGYELANHYTTYSATPSDFNSPAVNDSLRIRPANLHTEVELVKECYRRLAPRWNTMMDRDHSHWTIEKDSTTNRWAKWAEYWSADHRQIYLLENTATKAVAGYFAVSDAALPEGGYESTVNELMFESDDQLDYLARFCRRFPANVKKVKIIASPRLNLWHLFREPKVATSLHACYQARVIDVAVACSERGYSPDVVGNVSFAITDECAPWNAGQWQLKVASGKGTMTKADAVGGGNKGKLTLTIQEFSAIFTGYKLATDLAGNHPQHIETLATLETIFSGETRLLDFF